MSDRKLYDVLIDDYPSAKTRMAPTPVSPVDTRHGPWTGNQVLGASRFWDPATIGQQTIFKLPEWGMPKMWTVSLGIDTTQAVWVGPTAFDLTAEIIFGSGGSHQSIEVDWVNGSSISLPASAIEVVARLYNDTHIPFASPSNVRLSVQVGHGAIGVPSATRSYHIFCRSMTSSTPIRIPPFAKWFSILNTSRLNLGQLSAYAAQMEYALSTAPGGLNNVARIYGNMLPFHSCIIPVPATSRYFIVTNGGASDCNLTAVFGLAY